jgi:hypothetical protein
MESFHARSISSSWVSTEYAAMLRAQNVAANSSAVPTPQQRSNLVIILLYRWLAQHDLKAPALAAI